MRFFDIKLSFGVRSTASKILYLACDRAGDKMKNILLSRGLTLNNYNEEINNFDSICKMLASVIESNIDYKQYCRYGDETKSQIRDIIATALANNPLTRPLIRFDVNNNEVNYKPINFSDALSEHSLNKSLQSAFKFIDSLAAADFQLMIHHDDDLEQLISQTASKESYLNNYIKQRDNELPDIIEFETIMNQPGNIRSGGVLKFEDPAKERYLDPDNSFQISELLDEAKKMKARALSFKK